MRTILHVDVDAFYASVEQRDHPEWKGRPVIVGADPQEGRGRGVVAACSYEARRCGLRSAMPIGQAWRLCPGGVYVRPRMRVYAGVSDEIMRILDDFSPLVEPISIDEAFLDISNSLKLLGVPLRIAADIKRRILQTTGLTVSVGIAPNKLAAKIASEIHKPDGLVEVPPQSLLSFLHPLPAAKLWGVGPRMERELNALGIRTIGDVSRRSMKELQSRFGKHGGLIWQLACGVDDRPVTPQRATKSIGKEHTFEKDVLDPGKVKKCLLGLADEVAGSLRKDGFRAKTVALKLRWAGFETHTRQMSVREPLQSGRQLYEIGCRLLESFKIVGRPVRLVGLTAAGLSPQTEPSRQLELFEQMSGRNDERLQSTMDTIRKRFGARSIGRASSILP
ncbi:MAG: DNA polymerase IV [Elusimicrobia bacterium]|nr:DNA polymerase IV [Elusimicrobiota bacterium]